MEVAWLEEILETVREFGAASLALVAWELSLPEEDLAPAWAHAVRTGLLRQVGDGTHATVDDGSEADYQLATDETPAGLSPGPDGSH